MRERYATVGRSGTRGPRLPCAVDRPCARRPSPRGPSLRGPCARGRARGDALRSSPQGGRGRAPDEIDRSLADHLAMAAVIRAEGLTKRYGETLALDALDLAVEPGEVYGYLGPNGAGKTTTIRLLLGLHRPSGGRAELFGLDAWRDPVARAPAGRLRRGRAVPVAGADGRGDVRVPRAPARRHRRGLPRACSSSASSSTPTRRCARSRRATARRCSWSRRSRPAPSC